MSEKDIENLTLESYENEFSFKENKSNLNISFNRIAFIFFIFLMVCLIYSIKVFYLGSLNSKILQKKIYASKTNFRADILDRNGNFIAKTANTLTVATGGRGTSGTTAAAHTVLNGTYSVSQSSKTLTVTTSGAHNLSTSQRIYLDFTSGTNVVQTDSNVADPSNDFITYLPKDGLYDVTVTGAQTFTITIPEELRRSDPASANSYLDSGYPATISGNVSLLPEVRLRSL